MSLLSIAFAIKFTSISMNVILIKIIAITIKRCWQMEKLNVLGTVVEISDSLVEYNKIRKEFLMKAQKASSDFQAMYDGYGSYEQFVENFEEDALNLLLLTVSDCTKMLVDKGVLEVDGERFCKENNYIGEDLASVIDGVRSAFQKVDDTLRNNEAIRGSTQREQGSFRRRRLRHGGRLLTIKPAAPLSLIR